VLVDINLREIMVLLPLAIMMFVMGLYPKPFLSRMEPAVSHLLTSKFGHTSPITEVIQPESVVKE